MRLDHFKYLINVAESGCISQSAEKLYISQQGLSLAIQQMEIELGVILFHRDRNKITITDAGREAVEKVKGILTSYNELLSTMKSYTEPSPHMPLDELEVFSTSILCKTILPVTLNFLQKKYPYIKVKVQEIDILELSNMVESSSKCIGLFFIPLFEIEPIMALQKSDLIIKEINRYKIMACVSKSSPLAKKSAMSFDEFIEHPLAIYSLQTRILDHLYKDQYTPNIIIDSSNINLNRETIAKGLAIGFTNALIEKYLENKNVVPVPFEEDMDVVCYYLTTAEMLKNVTAKEFLKVLKSKAAI
jgi:DNA-binding transcriptional LysR family regulator